MARISCLGTTHFKISQDGLDRFSWPVGQTQSVINSLVEHLRPGGLPRDTFIGWNQKDREGNLGYLTNNMRFLILPWVRVPHLASHILSRIARRISADWHQKYGHPVYLLETFVDRSLFRGVCYQAANWMLNGQTKGRTRNDRNHTIQATVKDVYIYPLVKDFRRRLCSL